MNLTAESHTSAESRVPILTAALETFAPIGRPMMNVALWIAQGLLAFAMLAAGAMKVVTPHEKLAKTMKWAESWPPGRVQLLGLAETLGGRWACRAVAHGHRPRAHADRCDLPCRADGRCGEDAPRSQRAGGAARGVAPALPHRCGRARGAALRLSMRQPTKNPSKVKRAASRLVRPV